MSDEHGEPYMELPELNKIHIDDNKYNILQNRIMIVAGCLLAITVAVGSYLVLDARMTHSIEDCENRLYEKITGQKIQRDLFTEE